MYFSAKEDDLLPRQVFIDDLEDECREWNNMGNKITITSNFNEDVTSPNIKKIVTSLGLDEAIIKQHSQKPAQPSWNRERVPIDGIFHL